MNGSYIPTMTVGASPLPPALGAGRSRSSHAPPLDGPGPNQRRVIIGWDLGDKPAGARAPTRLRGDPAPAPAPAAPQSKKVEGTAVSQAMGQLHRVAVPPSAMTRDAPAMAQRHGISV